jgi:Flp pilus assembly protein TadD
VLLLGSTLYFLNIRVIQANTKLIRALVYCSGNNLIPSADLYAKSLEMNQYVGNQEAREQLIACAGNVSRGSYPDEVKRSFHELAVREIHNQLRITPNDARAFILGGTYFNNIGDWVNGRSILERAHELSPAKQTITFELATNYLNSGKEKEAEKLLEKAYSDAPNNETSQIAYVSALILTGQEAKAKSLFADKPEIFIDQRIISAYVRLKQYNKVIEILKLLVVKSPNDANIYISLASAYFANGQKNMTISTLEEIKVKFPQYKDQVDETIKQIMAGKDVLR